MEKVLEAKRSKYSTKIQQKRHFCLHSWFPFYEVSHAKPLHNKDMT